MEEMDWIDLAQGRDNGWDLENTTKKLWVA